MTWHEPEPDDPQVLVRVSLPAGPESVREMAAAFADEFAQMGHAREQILRLFRTPFYAGAHAALAVLGEEQVSRIVDESLAVFGGRGLGVRDAQ